MSPVSALLRLLPLLALLLFASSCGDGPGEDPPPSAEVPASATAPAVAHSDHDHGQAVSAAASKKGVAGPMLTQQYSSEGVDVEFSIGPVTEIGDLKSVTAGGFARVRFDLKDTATGQPLTPTQGPSAWIDLQKEMQGDRSGQKLTCEDKIKLFTQGTLSYRPDIDLNSYLVLTLNNDNTISVIDPIVGVTGISQMYSMVFLAKPGEDWVLSPDGVHLYVSMPSANQVAVAEMESFKVFESVEAGSNPVRVALQPDGRYLWVGNDSNENGGVTVIDVASLQPVAFIRTGDGHHEIAFTADGRVAMVSNSEGGTVSLIDTATLRNTGDVKTGRHPWALVFSEATGLAYVADGLDGKISAIDVRAKAVTTQIPIGAGVLDLRLSHDGLWGFALDPKNSRVHILDMSTGKVVATPEVVKDPDQLMVAHSRVYVRSGTSPEISIIDASKLPAPDLNVLQVIIGQQSPADSAYTSIADAIAPLKQHGNDILMANPAEKYVYYYMEGMQAPMGGFQNSTRSPRAVRVLDRSLRESAPGVYEAETRINESGEYQAAFFLDSPRVAYCFTFRVTSAVPEGDDARQLSIQMLPAEQPIKAGQPVRIQFKVADRRDGEPVDDLADFSVVATAASGISRQRLQGRSLGGGVYEIEARFPSPGSYQVFFTIPSASIGFDTLAALTILVGDSP